ncbi:stalk domain-containing protein [Paenibacillus sp. FSL H8-0034]|uniref:stalk domain-containing protein n=1 Tax=Paenibacillus sp. FSL H8-0034 TaxID=2954671 RepID=UPI0030FBDEF9
MKIIKSLLLTSMFATSIALPTNVFADDAITVYVDGQQLSFEVEPVIKDGTTLVPLRAIFEKFGYEVSWHPEDQTILGLKDGADIQMNIGNNQAYVRGKAFTLEVSPTIINGNTLVPLRFIGEASGMKIAWDGTNRRIDVKSQTENIAMVITNTLTGSTFTGEVVNGKPNGKGTMVLKDGSKFEGFFVDGVINGYGVATYDDGSKYEGYWQNGKWHGEGKLIYSDAHYYQGDFIENNYDGSGVEYDKNGNVLRMGNYSRGVLVSPSKQDIRKKDNDKYFTLSWGMSESEVKASRSDKPTLERKDSKGNNQIVYDYTFELGEKGKVGYIFNNTGLIEVMYLTESMSEFDDLFGVYTLLDMDLSSLYNNENGQDDFKWRVDDIAIKAYKKVYANDFRGMAEMAMRSNELTLLAQFKSIDSNIDLAMYNGGSLSKPSYTVGLSYVKK